MASPNVHTLNPTKCDMPEKLRRKSPWMESAET